MEKIIECVPNFSEGRDLNIIKQITDQIETVDGVKLLDVDPGQATNRTVVTIAGHPDQVIEAAYLAIKKASELIDMSKHSGEHPRMGATDVCPLIPISGISMEETVEYAQKLGKKVGDGLGIPIYLYENAASKPEWKNLATVRSGEYEALEDKSKNPEWKPDFGKHEFNPKSGATAIGARDFLIAFNVNLNTKSSRKANSVAFDLREQGRVKRIGNPIVGEIAKDENGNTLRVPGALKSVKGIGWYIDEYGIAQVSMNLTDINVTPLHIAFDKSVMKAQDRGIRVTGSELVGMVPLKVMTDAGKYYLKKQGRSTGISEEEIIHIAVKSMGLDELYAFDPDKKIIEYCLRDKTEKLLVKNNLREFANDTASESPAPGGGSIAAYVGSLGVSLGGMVASLSANKRGWEDRVEEFSVYAETAQKIKDDLLFLVDEDTRAFTKVMTAFGLANKSNEEKQIRLDAIESATKYAMEIPFKVMQKSYESVDMLEKMAEIGNPNSVSDAGVGILCVRTAVMGAYLNVKINAGSLNDKAFVEDIIEKSDDLVEKVNEAEKRILEIVYQKV